MNSPFETDTDTDTFLAATGKVHEYLGSFYLANSLWRQVKGTFNTVQSRREYTVAVAQSDDVYAHVHQWLMEHIPPHKLHSLRAHTRRRDSNEELSDDFGDPDIVLRYDGRRSQKVTISGHRVRVEVEKESKKLSSESDGYYANLVGDPEKIVFTTATVQGRDAVIAFLNKIGHKVRRGKASLYIGSRWNEWQERDDLPSRDLSTVYLPEGQKERIRDDLARFLGAEDQYNRLGLPYHRGYLFHGPPGTGKTSLARALATEFNLDLYFMPLTDLTKDQQLYNMFTTVEPRSMILLEDIDVVSASKTREDSKDQITLAGLLNALDGVITPHGLIVVMTTNKENVLDEALVREGRVDVNERLDYLTPEQFATIVEAITGERIDVPRLREHVSPARLIETLKSVVNGASAEEAIARFVN